MTGGRQRPQRKAALKLPSVLKAAGLLDDGAGQEYQVVTAQGDAIVASASGLFTYVNVTLVCTV